MTPTRLLLVALLAIPTVRAADPAPTTEPTDSEIGAALKAISAQPTEALVPAVPAVSIPTVTVPALPAETTATTTATGPVTPAVTVPSVSVPEVAPATHPAVVSAVPETHSASETHATPDAHPATETPVSPAAPATPVVSTEVPAADVVSTNQPHAAPAEPAASAIAAAAAEPAPAKAAHVDNSTASPAEHAASPADNSLKLTVSVPTEAEAEAEVPPLTPDADLASLLRIGDAKREQRDWPSATLAYRQVLNATSRATLEQTQAALLGLARSHRGAGNLTKACAVYELFAKDYPGDAQLPTVFLELGRCLRVLGAHRLAISRFYSVINSTLKVSKEGTDQYRQLTRTAQFEIAETYFQAGDYEQAHRFYSRLSLLDLAPADRARAAFKSAYSLNLQGNYEKAVTDLRSCLVLYPEGENAPEARYLLSIALRRLGRNQESLAAALELLKIEQSRTKADPKNWAHWQRKTGNQLANEFYEQGDAATALVIYQCLYDLGGPADWRIPSLYQIGLCQERLRQTGLARKTYQSILDTLRAPSGDGGKTAGLADVAAMAEWRLRHLDWLETTDKRLLVFVPPAKVEIPKPPALPVPAATP